MGYLLLETLDFLIEYQNLIEQYGDKELYLQIQPPKSSMPDGTKTGNIKVNIHRLLLETGIATTSAQNSEDPRASYAFFRYSSLIDHNNDHLCFNNTFCEMDSHWKQVASDELGCGITAYLMRDYFDTIHLIDTSFMLKQNTVNRIDNTKRPPDYCCITSTNELRFVESKGRSSYSQVGKTIEYAKKQLNAVETSYFNLASSWPRVAIVTLFDHSKNRNNKYLRNTKSIIIDPPTGNANEKKTVPDYIFKASYAKISRFCHNEWFAEKILSKEKTNKEGNRLGIDIEINKIPFKLIGYSPFGDLALLYTPIWEKLLFAGDVSENIQHFTKEFMSFKYENNNDMHIFNNGVVFKKGDNNMKYLKDAVCSAICPKY